MRKDLIAAASLLALVSGGALAQSGSSGTGGAAGAMAPAGSSLASAEGMMGKTVVGADGQEIGSVEDVILDANGGQATQLVISSGGFLGIGDRQIAVDYKTAQLDPANGQVKLSSLTREGVRDLPEFQYNDSITSLSRRTGSSGSGSNNNSLMPDGSNGSSSPNNTGGSSGMGSGGGNSTDGVAR